MMAIISPALNEDETAAAVAHIDELLATEGATGIQTQKMGRRKLAYPIKKVSEGFYTLTTFDAEVATIDEVNRRMKLNEKIIRHMTFRLDEK